MTRERAPTLGEEIANGITHGVGLLASLVAVPLLVAAVCDDRDPWRLAGVAVYAASVVTLYGVSTAYHLVPASAAKALLQRLDHAAIYLLIAGTYTPFMLVNLRGGWGWSLLTVVWALAVLGIVLKSVWWQRVRPISTPFYLAMGWLALVAIRPLQAHVAPAGLAWLFVGGLCYSIGVVFYHWERLRYGHSVWHLFVLAGSACHFWSVWHYSRPA
jgi:hemolysin III